MRDLPGALFSSPLPGLGRPLSAREGDLTLKYLKLLSKWQRTHRLVGSIEPAWLIENVVLASLAFLGPLSADVRAIADVGSGAGIPGVPLVIVRPDVGFSLIEVKRRRVSFLATVSRELGLSNIEVVATRVEDLAVGRSGEFDAAVMRCADDPTSLVPHVLALLRPGGRLVMTAKQGSTGPGEERVVVPMFGGAMREFRVIPRP